jgi:hypothetical protein
MTTQDSQSQDPHEPFVVVFEATTTSEALVVRGLLHSAGIDSPDFDAADPFPMKEPPEGVHGTEVWVRESQASDAARIIEKAQKNPGSAE